MITLIRCSLFFVLVSSSVYADASDPVGDSESAAILNRIKAFYTWALSNGGSVAALEPHIKNVRGSSKFYLDVSTLRPFSSAFMKSGYFSDDFPLKVETYYGNYRKKFSQYSPKEFGQIKKDGRGPLMETEDMDIFFCAQEYEYAQSFVDDIKLDQIKIAGSTASATAVSPYNWKTEFQFKKIGARWLIAGYCQYK